MLATLYEALEARKGMLPSALKQFYGELSFPTVSGRPYVVGNFVKAVDGPVTFGKGNSNPLFGNREDRLLMSILRAFAGAVVVGKDTLLDDPSDATWHWKTTVPQDYASVLREFSESFGPRPRQKNVFVSGTGRDFDFSRGVFYDADVQAVIATTTSGAARIAADIAALDRHPSVDVWALDDVGGGVDLQRLLLKLYEAGSTFVLLEGGPALYGDFERGGLVDEIFLSQRPFVAGNNKVSPRPTFSGFSHPAGSEKHLTLLSVKGGSEDMLFFRWRYVR